MTMTDPNPSLAVGIDLGTTFCRVAFIDEDGRPRIIPNDQGNRQTHSCVAFTSSGRLVGDEAKDQAHRNPVNTVYASQRLIGRKFSDPAVQRDIKHLPFVVKAGPNDRAMIEVTEQGGETKCVHPEEISALLLSYMCEVAGDHLGKRVTEAVITVPASFNDLQRKATRDAATIAGLEVLRLIDGPTAAALAHNLDRTEEGKRIVLVVDLGGGTCDATLFCIEEGVVKVRATAGNTHLGGEDFSNSLVEYLVEEVKSRHDIVLGADTRSLCRVRAHCEAAKHTLTSATEASIEIDSLLNGNDFVTKISRDVFNHLISDYFNSCLKAIEKVLKDSGVSKEQVQEIVLVGGSSRIPQVRELITKFFDGKVPCESINPDEAVASGAAVLAGLLTGVKGKVEHMVVFDVLRHSLGFKLCGHSHTLLRRNDTIPAKKTQTLTIPTGNSQCLIHVFEGEEPTAAQNNLLGVFNLDGIITSGTRGTQEIEVTFDVDFDGDLIVSVVETATRKVCKFIITNDSNRLSESEINHLVAEAEISRDQRKVSREGSNARNNLDDRCYVKQLAQNQEALLRIQERKELRKWIDRFERIVVWDRATKMVGASDLAALKAMIAETKQFVSANPNADCNSLKSKLEELKRAGTPIWVRVCRLSLGTSTEKFLPLIDENAEVPVTRSCTVITRVDDQPVLSLKCLHGGRVMRTKNKLIDEIKMKVSPGSAGSVEVRVEMAISENGVLTVTAVEEGTENSNMLTIEPDEYLLSPEEHDEMMRDILINRDLDEEVSKTSSLNSSFFYAARDLRAVVTASSQLTPGDKQDLLQGCIDSIQESSDTSSKITAGSCYSRDDREGIQVKHKKLGDLVLAICRKYSEFSEAHCIIRSVPDDVSPCKPKVLSVVAVRVEKNEFLRVCDFVEDFPENEKPPMTQLAKLQGHDKPLSDDSLGQTILKLLSSGVSLEERNTVEEKSADFEAWRRQNPTADEQSLNAEVNKLLKSIDTHHCRISLELAGTNEFIKQAETKSAARSNEELGQEPTRPGTAESSHVEANETTKMCSCE